MNCKVRKQREASVKEVTGVAAGWRGGWRGGTGDYMVEAEITMAEAETMIHTSTTDMIDTTRTMVTIDRTTNMPKQQKTRQ